MTGKPVNSSTQGYAEEAPDLFERYESISFAQRHQPVMHLLPAAPCSVLEIGAGTGADAAYFADLGHRVLAVEPVAELRVPAMALHPSPLIEWIDDTLPDLATIRRRAQKFELVMLTAVWMHLDAGERARAMPNLASMLQDRGLLIMSLRHGPVPPGRRMFDVSAEETIRLGHTEGLKSILNLRAESAVEANLRAGVTWTHLAFARDLTVP